MIKALFIKLERKIIRFLLKKVLSKSKMDKWVDSLLYKLEHLSNKTIIDDEISKHMREAWGIPDRRAVKQKRVKEDKDSKPTYRISG